MNSTFLDTIIVSAFGTATYGVWSVVFVFAPIFLVVSSGFSQVLLPKPSKRLHEGTPIDNVLETYYRFAALLIAPGVMGGWLFGDEIIQHIFGSEYVTLPAVAIVLLTTFGLQAAQAPSGSVFVATDRSRYATFSQIIQTIPAIIFLLLGGYVLDSIVVAALGLLVANLSSLGFSVWYQFKISDIGLPSKPTVIKLGIVLVAMAITVSYSSSFATDVLTMLAFVAIGALVYFATLFLAGFF